MTLTTTDIIILVSLLIIIGCVVYFGLIKHRKEPCYLCASKQKCKATGKNLREYYDNVCRKENKNKK